MERSTPRIQLSQDSALDVEADLLVVGVKSLSSLDATLTKVDKACGGHLLEWCKDEGFEAKPGSTVKFPLSGKLKAKWLVLVGVKGASADDARQIGHAAARASSRQKSAVICLPEVNEKTVEAVAEALVLGAYLYVEYKGDKPKGGLKKAFIAGAKKDSGLKRALEIGVTIGEAACLARDLVNAPPNDLNPVSFAEIAKSQAEELGLKVTVWGKKELEKRGMNLFLAVNKGSAIEPRMVHISYVPANPRRKVAFVGKGLTFDAGGLCIKPAKSMADMKCDMAGAATTVATVLAAARLELPVEVHAIFGATENMLGAAAFRPGDIEKSYDGKTVEMINTDAEGRLVLADVLAWTRDEIKPDVMIDHATLTGACMVALGNYRAGLYTSDDALSAAYLQASGESDEKFWRMPLDEDLRSGLDSTVADIKHIGGPYGGSITAALFLKEFVGKTPWMHLDIAGPAFLESAHGRMPAGGTGFGVGTAVRYLASL